MKKMPTKLKKKNKLSLIGFMITIFLSLIISVYADGVYDYEQELNMSATAKVTHFADKDYEDDKPVVGLKFNRNSGILTVEIDTTPPSIYITNPINGSTITENKTWLNVTTDEDVTCTFHGEGCPADEPQPAECDELVKKNMFTTDGIYHSYNITNLKDDLIYKTIVDCKDNSGNSNNESVTFYVNLTEESYINHAPVFISALEIPFMKEGDSHVFEVQVYDPDDDSVAIEWYLNSDLVSTTNQYNFTAVSAGVYTIMIVISDGKLNNSIESNINVAASGGGGGGGAKKCTTPTDGMVIIENTTFCSGTYNLPNGISIGADNVELDCNNAILNGTTSVSGKSAINISFINNIIIKNCVIENYHKGIVLFNSIGNQIRSNKLSYNRDGISLLYSKDNTIFNNFAYLNKHGIRLTNSNKNIFMSNYASNNTAEGFYFEESNNNSILGSNVRHNDVGIEISKSHNNLLNENYFVNNDKGISLDKSNNNSIIANVIFLNKEGIELGDSHDNAIKYNNIYNNTIGIDLYHVLNNYVTKAIEYNDIFNNTFQNLNNHGALDISVKNNYWGTTNITEIQNKIGDFYDDQEMGVVDFCPYLDNPYPNGEPISCEEVTYPRDYGLDTDNNGLYDYLVIKVNVTVPDSGYYTIVARLTSTINDDNSELTSVLSDTYLSSGENIVALNFSGLQLYLNGINSSNYEFFILDVRSQDNEYRYANYGYKYNISYIHYMKFERPGLVITSNFSDYGVDINNDGYYDYLTIKIPVNVSKNKNYSVLAYLGELSHYDFNRLKFSKSVYLSKNMSFMYINFSGIEIFALKKNGSNSLSSFTIREGNVRIYQDNIAYNTGTYDYLNFQRPYSKFIQNFSEILIDKNDNGYYDQLIIRTFLNITKPRNYYIYARLQNQSEKVVSWYRPTKYYEEGIHEVNLTFECMHLNHMGIDGPYSFKDIFLVDEDDDITLEEINNAYTTYSYNISNFQKPGVAITGDLTDYAIDEDDNGLFDYLQIEYSINVTLEGTYMFWLESSPRILRPFKKEVYLNTDQKFINLTIPGYLIYDEKINNIPFKIDTPIITHNSMVIFERWGEYNYTKNYTYNDFEKYQIKCIPQWKCASYNSCQPNDKKRCSSYYDVNDCHQKTNNDTYSISEEDSNLFNQCDYDNNNMIGNLSDVNTTLTNLSIVIGNSTNLSKMFNLTERISFKEENSIVLEFDYNFSKQSLNLLNITIEKQNSTETKGFIRITGLDLTSQNKTKTVYMNRIDANANRICIVDSEILAINEISNGCNGADEVSLICDGVKRGNYTCTLNNSKYKIEGLRHSAAIEYTYSDSGNDGGGGGGGGGSSRRTTNTSQNQTQVLPTIIPSTTNDKSNATEIVEEEQEQSETIEQPEENVAKTNKIRGMFIANLGKGNIFYGIIMIIVVVALLYSGYCWLYKKH